MLDLEKLDKKFDEILKTWTSKRLDKWLAEKDKEEQNEKLK